VCVRGSFPIFSRRIPLSEIERLRDCEAHTIGADHEQASSNARESELPPADAKCEVQSANVEERSANFAPSDFGAPDHEGGEHRSERDALAQELRVLRVKLEGAEERNEATRREQETLRETLERSDRDTDHLRGLTTQQSDTIRNLTEELKGLTIALHHEQRQRLELAAHIEDRAEKEPPKKAGFLRCVFSRKPKRQRRKFARVGPSSTRSG